MSLDPSKSLARPKPAEDPASLRAYLSQVRILEDPIDGRALVDARPEMEEYVEVHGRSAALSLASSAACPISSPASSAACPFSSPTSPATSRWNAPR